MTLTAAGPNAQQIEYWDQLTGPKWVALADTINAQIEPLGLEAMDAAGVAVGERVLDVGCGCGQTVVALAKRVGGRGHVTGIDLSSPMLQDAERRAREARLDNVALLQADAQTAALPQDLDLVFSRFGVMFFADPVAAFTNLHGALRPDGRLLFLCWQAVTENPWMLVPIGAVAKHVALPAPAAGPGAPGPFAFADAALVRDILARAGFSNVRVDSLIRRLNVAGGRTLDEAVDFLLQMGPAGAAMREAKPDDVRAIQASVREALLPYQTERGIELDAACWMVSAAR